jgi:hypothetical protein
MLRFSFSLFLLILLMMLALKQWLTWMLARSLDLVFPVLPLLSESRTFREGVVVGWVKTRSLSHYIISMGDVRCFAGQHNYYFYKNYMI